MHSRGEKDWLYYAAELIDITFEALGYHYVPHAARYAFTIFLVFAIIYVVFFVKCMMEEHEDEDEAPDDRASFDRRY